MIRLYKEMADWTLYNWDNYRLFYYILVGTSALGGAIIYQGVDNLINMMTNFFKRKRNKK